MPNNCRITITTRTTKTNKNAYSTSPCPISEDDNFISHTSYLICTKLKIFSCTMMFTYFISFSKYLSMSVSHAVGKFKFLFRIPNKIHFFPAHIVSSKITNRIWNNFPKYFYKPYTIYINYEKANSL